MKKIVLAAALLHASSANAFLLESLGWTVISKTATTIFTKDQSGYRDPNYESPVEEIIIDSKDARHCDPFGGCADYVSTTTIRRVREYRYDWKPEWDEWAYHEYE